MNNKGKVYREVDDNNITNLIIDDTSPNGFTIQIKPISFWQRCKDAYKLFSGRSIHYIHNFGDKEYVSDFCEDLLGKVNDGDGKYFEIERINKAAILPKKSHPSDSGFDVFTYYDFTLNPGYQAMIKLGYRIRIKPGYEIQMRSRSSIPVKYNCLFPLGVGTIDAGYRGEIMMPLYNYGRDNVLFNRGERIGQMVIKPTIDMGFKEGKVPVDTERGVGGFGSTGR